jgi:flavin-dependent dehydrogenase
VKSPSIYDVLVVGAGPAGASAAIRTRQAGLRTLLVEKLEFPRFRIGESLLPQGNHLLREIGVWPKLERAGFVDKFGARFLLGTDPSAPAKAVLFANGLVPGLEKSFQVDRARFDAILLDHAREVGAEVRTATTVRAISDPLDGLHTATLESAGGDTTTVAARYVIDAGGRDQFFPSALKNDLDPPTLSRRIALYNHFRGVPRAAGPSGGDTVIVRLAEGWFWLIPLDEERTSVGLVTTIDAFKAAGLSPAEYFDRVVAAAPVLRELLAGAGPTMPFHVTADYSYYRRDLAAGRLILTGDAGGFLDPIFSSGVYVATYSAKLAAALIVRAHRQNRPFHRAEALRYTRHLKKHTSVFHRLITAFYDENSFAVFMCQRPPFDLACGLTSIVAGHARLTWPLWWRFHLFLLVCRLQRHKPLVPPLPLAAA